MLFRNDIFELGGRTFRLLHTDAKENLAWVICIEPGNHWPLHVEWGDVCNRSATVAAAARPLTASVAMKKYRDKALERIGCLVDAVPDIYDERYRHRAIMKRAAELRCSPRTLHKDLRRYFQGGQAPSALLPAFHKSGRTLDKVTAGRGRVSKKGNGGYQLVEDDIERFHSIIKATFLKDARKSVASSFQSLLETYYTTTDGNGETFLLPLGERPSMRQFRYFLHKHYSLEVQLRAREGDKDFERDHASKLGDVLADCLGVGHYYEIDATIADVFLVLAEDRNRIVGKPTLFLISDRESNLIVGYYAGLENPSWIGARQAIYSIAQDKAELCALYGVTYDPGDWPAHSVFPKQFLADRGEMLTKESNHVSDDLKIGVANLPSQSPQKKPNIECNFKLIHATIKDFTPGYEPPSDAKRRCGKHYEQDACLTIAEFNRVILEAIIARNRAVMLDYNLSLKQIAMELMPSPINLWNHGIVERSGVLTRFSPEHVRHALLARDHGSITEEGIAFRGCLYTCPEAIEKGWFVAARKRRVKVEISFDARLVDAVRIHDMSDGQSWYTATLTTRSMKYRGLSFNEVKAYETIAGALAGPIEEARAQNMHDLHKRVTPVIDNAKTELKQRRTGKSRKARRADTKPDRLQELQTERQALGALGTHAESAPAPGSADVIALRRTARPKPSTQDGPTQGNQAAPAEQVPSAAQRVREARERMLRG